MTRETLTEIYELLYEAFGPQNWWPGETPFEVMAGAVLTQNTNWTNVEKAIANLKSAECPDRPASPCRTHSPGGLLQPEGKTTQELCGLAYWRL
ncbi:MAG: hypothetical protein ACYS7Y_26650 [Planctomycetota bacterium]|jgi:endonuclease-3 related protein